MKIFHFIDELRTGGAQIQLLTHLRELNSRGLYSHRVISIFGEGDLIDRFRRSGVEVDVFDFREEVRGKRFFKIMKELILYFEKNNPDIVEAHLTWSRVLALSAAKISGVNRRIAFEQGDIYFNSPLWRIVNFLWQVVPQDLVVCSYALKKWVRQTHGISNNKMKVIYNCIDPKTFIPTKQKEEMSREFSLDAKFVFCAVGTLGVGVNKRMDVAIRSIAEARNMGADVGLVICGDGEQRFELEELVKSLKLERVVRLLGTRADIPDVMLGCDAFCHSSGFEPFGIVCIEAMFMKLPVVVPDSGGIAEIVEHGVNGFKYPVFEVSELAKRMCEVSVQSQEDRRRIAENGFEDVMKRFTVQNFTNAMIQLYGSNKRKIQYD